MSLDKSHLTMCGTFKAVILWCLGAALSLCGCKSRQCDGPWIFCQSFTSAYCSNIPGCVAGPACEVTYLDRSVACSLIVSEVKCLAPECMWIDGSCVDQCRSIGDALTCNSTRATGTDSYGDPLWLCEWEDCLGTPTKTHCDQYPIDMCPVALGCSVKDVSGFPDN